MITTINNRVLIKPIVDKVTKAGIIIPGKKDDKVSRGEIVNKVHTDHGTLNKGDVVEYNKYTALDIEDIDGEKYVHVKYEDIYAIIK